MPSQDVCDGWPSFIASIFGIGMLTAVISDVASHFGCFTCMKDQVTAITVVALGTSVPGGTRKKIFSRGLPMWGSVFRHAKTVFRGVNGQHSSSLYPRPRRVCVPITRGTLYSLDLTNNKLVYATLIFLWIKMLLLKRKEISFISKYEFTWTFKHS